MKNERDASVETLLASTLKARADAASAAACLDAETLAAWADEALGADERASVEAHAADCARCQALLAAMVTTLPAPAAAASPWRMRSLWWLVPMTSAAAALAIWFAVPARAPVQQSESTIAAVDQVAPAVPAARSADAPANVEAEAPPVALRERREPAAFDKKAAPASPERPDALEDTANVARAAPAASAPSAEASNARREAGPAAARLSTFAGALDSVIVSSNPATRFRLIPGGGVQRSADGGATWRTELTGATETLTAGVSPSPSVCWLIGPAGTVLLSTDGRSWRRVAFPEAVDLRAISATDSENATVTTTAGRAILTTDGGLTWSRAPDL